LNKSINQETGNSKEQTTDRPYGADYYLREQIIPELFSITAISNKKIAQKT
jgi:hypothetical protein